jgi:hypothetical protein
VIALPFFLYFLLRKNLLKLEAAAFKSKYGCLYEGYAIESDRSHSMMLPMNAWFCARRFLTAIIIVKMRNLTPWIILTATMLLTFTDVFVKRHLSPYKNRVTGTIDKAND